MEVVKLSYSDEKGNAKSIDVKFKVPSAKVKSDLDLLDIKLFELGEDIKVRHKTVVDKIKAYETQSAGDNQVFSELIANDFEVTKGTLSMQADREEAIRNIVIRKFQTVINTKQLITEYQALVNLPETDDFWQEQDYRVIHKAVVDFLLQYPQITTKSE